MTISEIAPPEPIEPIDPVTGNRRVCAGGELLMPCNDDVCFGETCRNYPRAVCRSVRFSAFASLISIF